ncbi:MAG: phage gp6-like head-tail connector protein, partial [Lachnospiraceae bacterium]|nr:phage gp6-like head-tail connector protein [Lachnospiraceae bacterium]
MIITLKEVKEYARIDIDEDDQLLQRLITAAEEYLKNATGKEYPETDENGNPVRYELEKIYLQLL